MNNLSTFAEFGSTRFLYDYRDVTNTLWKTISWTADIIDPVVIAGSLTFDGGQPASVRIDDVNENNKTFKIALNEPGGYDQWHVNETFQYVVASKGNWVIETENNSDINISVGEIITNNITNESIIEEINFDFQFSDTPVVLTSTQDHIKVNNKFSPTWINTQQHNVDTDGFDIKFMAEGKNPSNVDSEIGWLAIDNDVWSIDSNENRILTDIKSQIQSDETFDHPNFNSTPITLAQISSYTPNTSQKNLRLKSYDKDKFVPSFQLKNGQISSDKENVNVLSLQGSGILKGTKLSLSSQDNSTDTIYLTTGNQGRKELSSSFSSSNTENDLEIFDLEDVLSDSFNLHETKITGSLKDFYEVSDNNWFTLKSGVSGFGSGIFRLVAHDKSDSENPIKESIRISINPTEGLTAYQLALDILNVGSSATLTSIFDHREKSGDTWIETSGLTDESHKEVIKIFNEFKLDNSYQQKFEEGSAAILTNSATDNNIIIDSSTKSNSLILDAIVNESNDDVKTEIAEKLNAKADSTGTLSVDDIKTPVGTLDFSVDAEADGTAVIQLYLDEDSQNINSVIKSTNKDIYGRKNSDSESELYPDIEENYLFKSQYIEYNESADGDFKTWLDNLSYNVYYYGKSSDDPNDRDVTFITTIDKDAEVIPTLYNAGVTNLGDGTIIDGSAFLIDTDGDGDIELVSALLFDQGFFDMDSVVGLIRDPITPAELPASALDTAAPAQPTISTTSLTNNSTPKIEGTAEAGSFVTLFVDGINTGVTADADATTGAFSMDAPSQIDGTYEITVTAADMAGNVSTPSSTLNLTVDTDPASISGEGIGATVSVDENSTLVGVYRADESVIWSLGGDDSSLFTIDVDGNLSFNEAPDFGDPNSSSGDNNYQLDIIATDGAGNVAQGSITVEVADIEEAFTGFKDTALTYNYRIERADDPGTDITGLLGYSLDTNETIFETDAVSGGATEYNIIIEAKVSGDSTSEKTVNLDTFDTTFSFNSGSYDLFNTDSATVSFGDEINSATSYQFLDNDSIRATGATLDKLNDGDIGIDSSQSEFTELFKVSGVTINAAAAAALGETGISFSTSTNIYDTVMSVRTNDNAEIKSLHELSQNATQSDDAENDVTIHEAYSEFKEQGTTLYTTRTIGASVNTALIRDGSVVNAISRLINDGTFETKVDKINLNQVGANSNFKIMIDDNAGASYPYAELDTGSLTFDSILSDSYHSGYITGDVVDGNSIYQSSSDGNSGWIGDDGGDIEIKFKVKVNGAVGQTLGDLDTGFFQISGDDVRTTTSKADGSTISDNLITFQGDINYDGRVSLKDLAFLNAGALNEGDGYAADDVDANYDGTISTKDLAIIDRDWGGNLHGISSLDTLISEDNWAEITNKGGKTFGAVSDVGSFDNSVWEKEATLNDPTLMADPLAGDIYSGEGNLYTGSNLYADDTKDFGTGSDPITGYDPS